MEAVSFLPFVFLSFPFLPLDDPYLAGLITDK